MLNFVGVLEFCKCYNSGNFFIKTSHVDNLFEFFSTTNSRTRIFKPSKSGLKNIENAQSDMSILSKVVVLIARYTYR